MMYASSWSSAVLLRCLQLVTACFTLLHGDSGGDECLGCGGKNLMSPPREPPSSQLDAFTLNGTVPLELYYVDDSNKGQGICGGTIAA